MTQTGTALKSNRASVSLISIVRNEGHQLAACLAPVAELFDEIVVVDTGSRDDTREVAGRFAARIFDFPWCDDFAAARNESLRRATGDWVMWLDADDRLSPANVQRLHSVLAGLNGQPQAFMMETVCTPATQCEGLRLVTHPRLFRRHPELRWQGRVHEQLRPAPQGLGFECVPSEVQIEHVGYADPALRQRKLQRDLRLLGLDYAVNPGDISTLLHLGTTHAQLGHNDKARRFLLPLIAAGLGNAEYLRQVFGLLAELAFREGRYGEVLEHASRGLQQFPDDEHLLYVAAEAQFELSRYESVHVTLARLLGAPPAYQYRGGGLANIRTQLAPRLLANTLRMQDQTAAAENVLRALLREFPRDTHSFYLLGLIQLDANCRAALEEVMAALPVCPQGEVFAGVLEAMWQLRHGALDSVEPLIARLVATAPQLALPRLLRIEALQRRGAPKALQIQACRDLLRVDPGDREIRQLLAQLETAEKAGRSSDAASDWSSTVVLGMGLPEAV